ncbi:glycosyltransferase family 2 protein [Flavobacterium sp. 7A]|uniref:glycosyltransferase family 2 protein n=1 Tax=Flavobacterium sp. 7A TaxID=2940571 RepID=UPI0022269DCD|nr:glycosyltransferase family 2 protein [Flavobacterium sp. 7A]MCW2119235.1 glycosyltransferase involved in cell wall biosynthesis [Flavobacterium sp. 7A]
MRTKITALAITLNEEANVKQYIESLAFADEIIFIDSFSTDATVSIAKELGATVIQRPFDDFSSQRNFAIQQAKNDWIVFFDLDEIISPELVIEITKTLSTPCSHVAYKIKTNLFFMGQHIKYGGWYPDKVIRLFNKKNCRYNGKAVSETLQVLNGTVGQLTSTANHFSYKGFDNYNQKLSMYSQLQAKNLYSKNQKPTLYYFFIKPFLHFNWYYFFRLGILGGKAGFIIAYVHSFAVFKCYLQLWMMYRKIE